MSVEMELSIGSSNEPSYTCSGDTGELIQDMKQRLSTYYTSHGTPSEVEIDFPFSTDSSHPTLGWSSLPSLASSDGHSCSAVTNGCSHTALSNGHGHMALSNGENLMNGCTQEQKRDRRRPSNGMCEHNSLHKDSSLQPGSVDMDRVNMAGDSHTNKRDIGFTELHLDDLLHGGLDTNLAKEGSQGSCDSLVVEGSVEEAEDFEVAQMSADTPVAVSQPRSLVLHSEHSKPEEGRQRRNSGGERDELFDQLQEVSKAGIKLGPQRVRKSTPAWLALEDFDRRRLSDPASRIRRDHTRIIRIRRQRCVSDSEAPEVSAEDDEPQSEGGGSAQDYDSGFNEEIRAKYSNSSSTTGGLLSLDSEGVAHDAPPILFPKHRKITPYPAVQGREEDSRSTPLAVAHRAKRPLSKHLSCSSMGTSTESSVWEWECGSVATVTDILSSLGFDDFDSPELVPDRFIPKEVEHVKPTLMRAQSVSAILTPSPCDSPELEPSTTVTSHELPLGATADNLLTSDLCSASPPIPAQPPAATEPQHQHSYSLFSPLDPTVYNPAISQIDRGRVVLETVVEETASDLSPSPRWLSPRVSIDHSVADCKMGHSLTVQKPRKRSLPSREGYKISIGSQVESEPESIYFSVTSYDDKITQDKEREESVPIPLEDQSPNRRRRRGVYTPPPGLLTWLNTQKSISEEEYLDQDPNELPWPFSEQVRLRKSLTEIQRAQLSSGEEHTCERREAECDPSPSSPTASPPSPYNRAHFHSHSLLPHCSNPEDEDTSNDFHDALPFGMAQTQVLDYHSECQQELDSAHRREGALEELDSAHRREGALVELDSAHRREGALVELDSAHRREGALEELDSIRRREGALEELDSTHRREGALEELDSIHKREGAPEDMVDPT